MTLQQFENNLQTACPETYELAAPQGAKRYVVWHRYGASSSFGDDRNDLEMIREAGIGVAMGNAIDIVKETADHVTDSCENLGVVKALHHFGLLAPGGNDHFRPGGKRHFLVK